jgi:hypothetical protein
VVNNCTNSQLSGFSWWEDRNSNKIAYWDGSFDESTTGCACFLTGDGCETRSQKSRNGGTNVSHLDLILRVNETKVHSRGRLICNDMSQKDLT